MQRGERLYRIFLEYPDATVELLLLARAQLAPVRAGRCSRTRSSSVRC